MDRIATFRQVRVKQRSSPWMDQKILEILKGRNSALSIYRKTKNQENYIKFKALRTLGQKNIRRQNVLLLKEKYKKIRKILNLCGRY